MEKLTLPLGVTWTTGVGLRGVPQWGPPGGRRRGQQLHRGGLFPDPPGRRRRRGGSVGLFPPRTGRTPPGGVRPVRLGVLGVGRFFPNGVAPLSGPTRGGADSLGLLRGGTPRARWCYLFARGGRFPSLGWSKAATPREVSPVFRGRPYQSGYLTRLAYLTGKTKEDCFRRVNRVVPRGGPWGANRGTTRLTRVVSIRSKVTPRRGAHSGVWFNVSPVNWTPPPGGLLSRTPRVRPVLRSRRRSRGVRLRRLVSLTVYRRGVKINFFLNRPRRWRRKGTGKLARRYRTFEGDLRRRWRWYARPPGWHPRRRPRRRWLRRRRKWFSREVYRFLRRNRRGRPRRGYPRRGGFLGFSRPVRWPTGVVRFRRFRRFRRRWTPRGRTWSPRRVHRAHRNALRRRSPPRGGRLPVRVRHTRVNPRRPRFWRFRSPRVWRRRFHPRGKIHLRRGGGLPPQGGWWSSRGFGGGGILSRWGGIFTSGGVPRGGLRRIIRVAPAGVFQRVTWLLGVGLAHYPRTRAGTLQRVPALGTPRGRASLVRKWLKKGMATRGERTWAARAAAELFGPSRAVRSREDYLKVAVAGGALL